MRGGPQVTSDSANSPSLQQPQKQEPLATLDGDNNGNNPAVNTPSSNSTGAQPTQYKFSPQRPLTTEEQYNLLIGIGVADDQIDEFLGKIKSTLDTVNTPAEKAAILRNIFLENKKEREDILLNVASLCSINSIITYPNIQKFFLSMGIDINSNIPLNPEMAKFIEDFFQNIFEYTLQIEPPADPNTPSIYDSLDAFNFVILNSIHEGNILYESIENARENAAKNAANYEPSST